MPNVPERIGPYQIIRLLGLGGMAQVYHARKSVEGVDLVAALKVPRQHVVMDPGARKRFLKEAHITTRLGSHPNIVQVLDVGVDGELPYMALEYITGVDLGRLCNAMINAGTRWPEPAILWVLAGILQGLRHAWGAEVEGQPLRIVHRDISPSNILVTYEGQIKVTDFGISRMAGLDTSGSIRGKARYMPYEQMMGQVSAASDLFAVGAIAWELIEGKPFRHDKPTENEMLLAMMAGEIPAITRTDVSPRLAQLVVNLLQHHDKQRPQTPMDAWLELKTCPGLNVVDPDPVRALIEEFLGQHRQSGYTGIQVRIHPELVATRAALAAAAGDSALPPSEAATERASPPSVEPGPPRAAIETLEWPYESASVASVGAVDHHENEAPAPPQRALTVRPPRSLPLRASASHRSRALGLAGLGLLLGGGIAVGAMKLLGDSTATAEARPAPEHHVHEPPSAARTNDAAPPSSTASTLDAVVLEPAAASVPVAISTATASPRVGASDSTEPTRADEPTATPEVTIPTAAPAPLAKPRPKPAPRATLHVRLDLVPELELRLGSRVRRITGSVSLPVSATTKVLAVRTPGSTTWYPSSAKLEPGREYLVRLHAKRVEIIPLDRGP